MDNLIRMALGISSIAFMGSCAIAPGDRDGREREQLVDAAAVAPQGNPDELLWGDIHLHTEYSMDANTFGVRLSPDDAYRFAKGEAVTASNGMKAQLEAPLDFLMVSDHSDYLGSLVELRNRSPKLLANSTLAEWLRILGLPTRAERLSLEGRQTEQSNPAELDADEIRGTYWAKTIAAAEEANQPGEFTSFIGFEWTAQDGGRNLHRVVMFRDGAERTLQTLPLSARQTDEPQELWSYLQAYEQKTGGRVLAVAHNGNISNGAMFPLNTLEFGGPMTAEYASARARWEPAYEVTQIKGDGETHPFLSADDDFADYETWDRGDFAGVPKTKDMLPAEYARSALLRGLTIEQRFGTNPYKMGLIGSTDAHTALAAVDEDNFWGKHSAEMEPGPTRWKDAVGGRGELTVPGWMMASSGYTAVWARENTRAEIWDAFKRREVYATTGPRIRLRFFGGWSFTDADARGADLAATGYVKGVPMGGDLGARAPGKVPSFLIQALRDPNGASLDRIQVIKGWLDTEGNRKEKVFDVAWSHLDKRKRGADGKPPKIAGNVDMKNATYDDSVGATQLVTMWRDPQFNPRQNAFYYVRVLQIPTPRWTTYDAKRFGIQFPDYVPTITQERAYSSPIWYSPY